MSLEKFAFAVPSVKQSASDIAEQTGASEDFIRDKIGLAERYILGKDDTGVGLGADACRKLMDQAGLSVDDVDLLVCVTQNPDRKLPQNSAGIASELDLPRRVAAFDIALGCSGYVYGIQIVEGFLKACGMKTAILVTCDPYSRIMAGEDHNTNCVFGDAAAATLITLNGSRSELLGYDCGTDGGPGDAISIASGGARKPLVHVGDSGEGSLSYEREEARLVMKGRAVFNFVLSTVPGSINNCLEKAGLQLDDVDYFALHQGSIYMLDALAKNVGIPPEKVLKNMNSYGNTVSSTIPMLLEDLDATGKLSGSTVLLSGFGVGLSWASAVIRFN